MIGLNILYSMLMAGSLLFSSCLETEAPPANYGEIIQDRSVLIVYLSRTKNTKAIAEIIHRRVGGTLVELELVDPYPENYRAIVQQVADENASGFLPPLKTQIADITQYDVVFLGFPTWGMQLPPPMKSFLMQYDLSGKTVIPFNTNAGYGIGSSFDTVKELCPDSRVLEGISIKGGIERDGIFFVMEGDKEKSAQTAVGQWLKEIGFDEVVPEVNDRFCSGKI